MCIQQGSGVRVHAQVPHGETARLAAGQYDVRLCRVMDEACGRLLVSGEEEWGGRLIVGGAEVPDLHVAS